MVRLFLTSFDDLAGSMRKYSPITTVLARIDTLGLASEYNTATYNYLQVVGSVIN